MTRSNVRPRRPGRLTHAVALLTTLVLLIGVVVTGLHQHERGSVSHPCAVCTLGHAAAVAPVVPAGLAPLPRLERVMVERALTPARTAVVSASSRAPPAA